MSALSANGHLSPARIQTIAAAAGVDLTVCDNGRVFIRVGRGPTIYADLVSDEHDSLPLPSVAICEAATKHERH